ncbi:MAG: histidine kinase dimerization/phospho-acceptor domain-containing protein, partial [Pseudoxanthomonas sp.]
MSRRTSIPLTLRHRVALASTVLGFLLSLVFTAAVIVITEDYDQVLAMEILQGQADDYSLRLANHLTAELPQTHRLTGYLATAPGTPPEYKVLPLGVHEDAREGGTQIGVFDTSAGRLIFVIDLSDTEVLDAHLDLFLAGMVVLGTALAGWLGWWLAGLALRPVQRLVSEVDALPVQPRRSNLGAQTSQDELGKLAHAIDAYQDRLVDADSREQAFFADASHELRTPLSVVQGVTEVMLDDLDSDRGNDPAQVSRLRRLERGVRDMGNLIEALLGVARRSDLQSETVDARMFLHDAAHIALADAAASVVIEANGALQLPRREALLLVSGLVRKFAQQPTDAPIHLTLQDDALLIDKQVDAALTSYEETIMRSDTGRGSALLDRLAQRLSWQVEFESATRIRI